MSEKKKIILSNHQAPGDVVMLTAALRDLHACNPNKFVTDIRSPCPDLWSNNPHLHSVADDDPKALRIECQYPLIHQANRRPYHFIHGFMQYLAEKLDVRIRPTEFRGDIHLSQEETSRPALLPTPYWIIVAGGKLDFTIKWWALDRYQKVVDHFRDRIRFVQVGESGHHHPPLDGVTDLRGKTTLRELVLLMHHAQGVLCPVTLAMHLAAAVPSPHFEPGGRPCVVVAGGREPVHWEMYPGHQFLHTIGALACCATGGCWRSRTLPLPDKDRKNSPRELCKDVIANLPRCMHMIEAQDVINAISLFFDGGQLEFLK